MRQALLRPALLLGMVAVTLTGCSSPAEADLCSQVAGLEEAAGQLRDLDPEDATADDVRAIADDVLRQLDQVQGAADGAYFTAISVTRAAVTDLRQAAADLGEQDLEIVRPLLRESATAAVTAYRVLERRLDTACAGTEGS